MLVVVQCYLSVHFNVVSWNSTQMYGSWRNRAELKTSVDLTSVKYYHTQAINQTSIKVTIKCTFGEMSRVGMWINNLSSVQD